MPDYRISIADANAHRWAVDLEIEDPGDEVIVSLPVWIPGSYMVREFARHLLKLEARIGRRSLVVEVIDKTTWRIRLPRGTSRGPVGTLHLRCEVYGFDPSIRASFIDGERGFFNGTSLLLRVHGREQQPHRLRVGPLPSGWRVATSMAKVGTAYVAADYDEAVDHPFELGRFWRGRFEARGVEHEFVVAGAWPGFDGERLLADTKKICEAQIDFWHGRGGQRARRPQVPFERYVFMLHAVDDGYGGLEHRASTALMASRKDLPRKPASGRGPYPASDGYVTLLGLISHEYFHTWNVKRLKPAELARIDYTRENPSTLLWFFEGFTSYYDDLLLRRAGLIGDARYLGLIAKHINATHAVPGRKVQSVARASFDAWTKYYRSDEATPNLTVSYYMKGSLVALALDLTLRSEGRGCLDDVMRHLWMTSGAARGEGAIDEAAIAQALRAVAGRPMDAELRAWVHGTDDLPVTALLEAMGVSAAPEGPDSLAAVLGLRVVEGPNGVMVKHVLDGGVAQRAGVAAGDELIAFDGWRLRKLDDALMWWTVVRPFQLTVVRGQRLMALRVGTQALKAAAGVPRPIGLSLQERLHAATARRRQHWLHGV